jgi:K+-transporting ATPase ATPase C chain
MRRELRPAIVAMVVFTVLTGLVYPLAMTGLAQVLFPRQAQGSLISRDGHAIGSTLIGQPFDDPKYFWGRLSATSPFSYNASASSGSNLGPTSKALREAVAGRVAALRAADPQATGPVPVDLVTASASGLDPDISPAAADYQVRRVARVRGISEQTVRQLVGQSTAGREFGVLGEPRVNVLELNLRLDGLR